MKIKFTHRDVPIAIEVPTRDPSPIDIAKACASAIGQYTTAEWIAQKEADFFNSVDWSFD